MKTCKTGTLLCAVIVSLCSTTRGDLFTLRSGTVGSEGRMQVRSDEFGYFAGTDCGGISRVDANETQTNVNWMCVSGLFLTDGEDMQFLADDRHWLHPGPPNGNNHNLVGPLSGDVVTLDERTPSTRTSKYAVEQFGIEVDLVQNTPEGGFNYIQTYTFSNVTEEIISVDAVLVSDFDLGDYSRNRIGFTEGVVPKMYVFEEEAFTVDGMPASDDISRMAVAASMGDGITLDGYLGLLGQGSNIQHFLSFQRGIPNEQLDGIYHGGFKPGNDVEDNDVTIVSNADVDGNCFSDAHADISGAMQFTMEIPPGESTSLTLDYFYGSLGHASIDLGDTPNFCGRTPSEEISLDGLVSAIRSGTNDARFDFTGDGFVGADDLVQFVESPDHLNTYVGDSNLDGEFNSSDFVTVFVAGRYEIDAPANWREGDWNADGRFDSGDFVAAFMQGGYEAGPRGAIASAVPEPTFGWLSLLSGLLLARSNRFRFRK